VRAAPAHSLPLYRLFDIVTWRFISLSLANHFKYSMVVSGAGDLMLISFGARIGNTIDNATCAQIISTR